MQTTFHHEDVPPQNWLDELHSFNIPYAWDITLNNNQRTNLAKKNQDQLNAWRVSLRDQMKKIDSRFDSSNREKMEQTLVPYKMLDSLGDDIHEQLRDLADRVKNGRAIPEGFAFGSRIFGDHATKRWHFGEQEDEQRWRDFLPVERRLMTLTKEYKVQSRGYDNAKKLVQESQSDLAEATASYDRHKGFLQIGVRLFTVMLTVLFCLALGLAALVNEMPPIAIANEIFAAVMLIIAVVAAISAVMIARRRRESIAKLETNIAVLSETLRDSQQEARRQKQYLLPTRQTLKEVRADYQALKATF